MLRYRGKKINLNNIVKELDTFPKVQDEIYEQTSYANIILTILIMIFGFWLIISEVRYALQNRYIYKFIPDVEYDSKLPINIDITVKSNCDSVGADIVDSTGQNMMLFGEIETEDAWWEMSEEEQLEFDEMRLTNSYLREEYHSLNNILWRDDNIYNYGSLKKSRKRDIAPDACRLYGSLILNKVTGNFHITSGKSLLVPGGHVHLTGPLFGPTPSNFSHRINRLSFGTKNTGIINPLEGEVQIATEGSLAYHYFIDVVATDIKGRLSDVKTYQYSAKDLKRVYNDDNTHGNHGMSGIFFKYDINALKFVIAQDQVTIFQFIIKIASSFGGFLKIILDKIIKFFYQKYDNTNFHSKK
ncbi:endoplasmic reticulum-Golgi intermediate compartment protein 2 isoform X2 [Daktulosphaira vitifoliae]|uniref:endoplasmic reticulum-Golgi intermediate compartment protein 2 isoform X2 n=1 Tax=Daktulosphaira vitifoliae TaxID=58002 RepID=UPI0021AA856B|nr:endoplasmic reticulum-Golgi intermediate compartment protein 2 isoform X2 [Daktulosphaira vitifoliae]